MHGRSDTGANLSIPRGSADLAKAEVAGMPNYGRGSSSQRMRGTTAWFPSVDATWFPAACWRADQWAVRCAGQPLYARCELRTAG